MLNRLAIIAFLFLLTACVPKGPNPADPYESINREIHKFNMAFDATMLRPPATLYKNVVPKPIRAGINNFYNNINMIPTVINDVIQLEWNYAIKDTWRFIANSTIGLGGVLDVASTFNLPPHTNDLGVTFAKWGDMESPYIVIPFLGPSTIRDGMGLMFNYTFFTPYPYLASDAIVLSLLGFRYIDLRAELLETDRLLGEALDQYTLLRDAYLQHRHFVITGEHPNEDGALYVDDEEDTPLSPLPGTPIDKMDPLIPLQ